METLPDIISRQLKDAESELNTGSIQSAAAICFDLLTYIPDCAPAYEMISKILETGGKWAAAEEAIEAAVQSEKGLPAQYHDKAWKMYAAHGKLMSSLQHALKAYEYEDGATHSHPCVESLNHAESILAQYTNTPGETASPIELVVPWRLTRFLNGGMHPIITPLISENYPNSTISLLNNKTPGEGDDGYRLRLLRRRYRDARHKLLTKFSGHPIVTQQSIDDFLKSRSFFLQWTLLSYEEGVHFHHTTPYVWPGQDFILHFENPITVFSPFIQHSNNKGLDIKKLPAFWIIKHLLESDNCKAIFTHIQTSFESLRTIFDSETITQKLRYTAVSVSLTQKQEQEILPLCFKAKESKETLDWLFVNSFFDTDYHFRLRGGHYVVAAFNALAGNNPNLHLTIRSRLSVADRASIQQSPYFSRIRIIDDWLPEDDLIELFGKADIFVLPSSGLRSGVVLTAMTCKTVVVTSDALGFEEYIKDGDNGLMISGLRDKIYSQDQYGFWHDDFSPINDLDPSILGILIEKLQAATSSGELRKKLTANSTKLIESRYNKIKYRADFQDMLTSIS